MYLACEGSAHERACRLGSLAEQLAKAFDVSPDFFKNLEREFLNCDKENDSK